MVYANPGIQLGSKSSEMCGAQDISHPVTHALYQHLKFIKQHKVGLRPHTVFFMREMS